MPPKDRHGKTAQDYRAAVIAEIAYRSHRKAHHSLLPLIWSIVTLLCLILIGCKYSFIFRRLYNPIKSSQNHINRELKTN